MDTRARPCLRRHAMVGLNPPDVARYPSDPVQNLYW